MRDIAMLSAQQSERFWRKVPERPGEPEACWEWTGARSRSGYGRLTLSRTQYSAHRVAYVLANGSIPQGCEIDHICHNRKCVRPSHLEAVPRIMNQRRSWERDERTATKSRNTHCPHGHEFSEENTQWRISPQGRPYRRCRTCDTMREKARPKRKKRRKS